MKPRVQIFANKTQDIQTTSPKVHIAFTMDTRILRTLRRRNLWVQERKMSRVVSHSRSPNHQMLHFKLRYQFKSCTVHPNHVQACQSGYGCIAVVLFVFSNFISSKGTEFTVEKILQLLSVFLIIFF